MQKTNRKIPPNIRILKLSFMFFGSGMLLFLIGMGIAPFFIPKFVEWQSMRIPQGWFLAHLFILGWATMIAMGASYQIIQIVMRTDLYSRNLGYIHFFLYITGLIGLLYGLVMDGTFIVVSGGLVGIGALLYVNNVLMTFIKKREWNVFVFGVSLSLIEFLLTIVLGILMGGVFAFGWSMDAYEMIFKGHLWFGLGGWMAGLIMIFSFKLMPMFYVSTKKVTNSTYWIIGMYHLGLFLHVISFFLKADQLAVLGLILLLLALSWFVVYMFDVKRNSRARLPIGPIKIAFYLIPVIYLLFLGWNILNWFGIAFPHIDVILIIALILGWFSASILSYLFKIIPFLWWPYRFQTIEDRKNAILLYEMLPGTRMTAELLGYLGGMIIVLTGFIFNHATLAVIGQITALLFVIIYLIEMTRVFRY